MYPINNTSNSNQPIRFSHVKGPVTFSLLLDQFRSLQKAIQEKGHIVKMEMADISRRFRLEPYLCFCVYPSYNDYRPVFHIMLSR